MNIDMINIFFVQTHNSLIISVHFDGFLVEAEKISLDIELLLIECKWTHLIDYISLSIGEVNKKISGKRLQRSVT